MWPPACLDLAPDSQGSSPSTGEPAPNEELEHTKSTSLSLNRLWCVRRRLWRVSFSFSVKGHVREGWGCGVFLGGLLAVADVRLLTDFSVGQWTPT